MEWGAWKLKNHRCLQKTAWDVHGLLPVIMNDVGILKKWKASLWWGLGEPLPCQSLRDWLHSSVKLTSGRTKQKENAKSLLISTKLVLFISVRKDWWGHILYLIFCYFFSHVSEMVWIIVIFYKLTHALHLGFCTSPLNAKRLQPFR